jgi:2-C-methyl-D-erythritol 4-phosphate cytidylyltransferase/2-C-methyl-D-erythritol 2,4-cyclodiphosphate synthase
MNGAKMDNGVAALVVAAGRGVRSGGEIPKQYRAIGGITVLRRTLCRFLSHPGISFVQAVIHGDDEALYRASADGLDEPTGGRRVPLRNPVHGGATRQASVLAGLEALAAVKPALVLIHDAARPFASDALVSRAIAAGTTSGAAIPALPVTDTIKSVDAEGTIVATVDRAGLRAVQTPQAFDFEKLLAAHRRAAAAGRDDFTDDAGLAEWAGMRVTTFEGEAGNMKLTTAEDFVRAERLLAPEMETRTGMGFDVHAFGDGDHVTLGGVRIAHPRGLSGHSDADVVLHAAVDAILGALSDGDIGAHFPPSDPQWRGATSDRFLRFAVDRLKARGGTLKHLDITVVCEAPKIGPHRDAMRATIARVAGITPDRVGVKATTSEGLGFTGRREGIVAYATATISLPAAEAVGGKVESAHV